MGGWPIEQRMLGQLLGHRRVRRDDHPQRLGHRAAGGHPTLAVRQYTAADYVGRSVAMMGLEVLRQDYIRTAWSKGLLGRSVILRHAIKNAIIPVVTLVGMQLPILVGGSVIIENIFNVPGLGRLMLDALNDRYYPLVSAVNLFFATVVVLNLLTDLLYASLDPRSRGAARQAGLRKFRARLVREQPLGRQHQRRSSLVAANRRLR